MNNIYEEIYKFYGVTPPVNKNQGFYLNLSQMDLEHMISQNVELEDLKSSSRRKLGRDKGLPSQGNKEGA
jgi:hypothetical protein